jgi:ATP-dependent RNA helicase RhlE
MNFKEMNLNNNLQKALKVNNYINCSQIQENTIPLILDKHNVQVQAQTGSGKTLSFVLPILNSLTQNTKKAKIKALILTPTRELTLQIANVFVAMSECNARKTRILSLIGGEDISKQLMYLQQGCDIVIASPGRLIDIINKQQIDLKHIEYFVLDEADKLLNVGFKDELNTILQNIPISRQNLFFSATYSSNAQELLDKISKNIKQVFLKENIVSQKIVQKAILINIENRNLLLKHLLKTNNWDKIIVFVSTKKQSDNIAYKFRKNGYLAESYHGKLDQIDREYTLNAFKNNKIKILFCTDLASRGLDIDNVSCVINYDLPRSANDYIHRIGRTARFEKYGDAISFIFNENFEHFKLVQKKAKINLTLEQIKGFELKGELGIGCKNKGPIKGKRKSKKDKLREFKSS